MRDGKLFPFVCVFTGNFGMRKVQCYLSVQVIVLLEISDFTPGADSIFSDCQ